MTWPTKGLAVWTDDEAKVAFLSVAFTWNLNDAFMRACWWRAKGYRVRAGGPALFLVSMQQRLADVAELGGDFPDAIAMHNPLATIASRGCPVGCSFCIVPAMEGRTFTLLPDFRVRPVLCDNNLSALPADYQDYIVKRYSDEGVPLLDANSGFEPATFTEDVHERWRNLNLGPWRFAYDETKERADVQRVMQMLAAYSPKRKRVYVLIGNEPFEACMARIREVIEWGGEPHVQAVMKLNALDKKPWVRFDWTAQKLTDVSRWANGRVWRKAPFDEYDRARRSAR